MNTHDNERLIYDCARDAFESILQLDLQKGICTDIFSPAADNDTENEIRYTDLVENFVQNHARGGKEELSAALNLERVRTELKDNGRYMVFGGTTGAAEDGYKMLTFLPKEDTAYATLYCMNFSNIADYYNKKLHALKDENYRDSLTNAFNRNYYEHILRNRQMDGGVAIIDLDDFKLCNDTYGHDVGDLALTEAARIILHNIRSRDTLVRFGGDEFLLVLPNYATNQMTDLLEKIREEINGVQHSSLGTFRLSVSIGAVSLKNETVSSAAYRADRIMYLAKKQKNTLLTEHQLAKNGGKPKSDKADRQKLLIADDSDFNRALLSEQLEGKFDIVEAANGEECMAVLENYRTQISLVLLDVIMPVMNGFSVLKEMGEKHLLEDIPVIMISADDSDASIRRALEMGATDYISRPFDATAVGQRILNTVKLYAKQRRILTMLTEQTREKESNSRIMIDITSNVIGYINGESSNHIQHMKKLTAMLLERLVLKTDQYGLAWQDCELIATAAMLHDVGKVGIDPAILNKPGRLTPEEYQRMKAHTLIGESILTRGDLATLQDEPLLQRAIQICRWHHERFDGKGYPDGLVGDDIPIAAQVVGIADVYDALVSHRCYKSVSTPEQALQMIQNGECGSFNPILVECLSDILEKSTRDIYSA